ncbi:IS66 family transposase [Mycetohabitans sp. B46]|uniref:IS66 family transposase n=1 Tax=Mycetohabitans sp. B46 TaxID=2772536 RepID=UPI00307DDAF4
MPNAQRGRNHLVSGFIRLIEQLFGIESRCEGMSPENRLLTRQRESRVALGQIEALLLRQSHAVLPQRAYYRRLPGPVAMAGRRLNTLTHGRPSRANHIVY